MSKTTLLTVGTIAFAAGTIYFYMKNKSIRDAVKKQNQDVQNAIAATEKAQ